LFDDVIEKKQLSFLFSGATIHFSCPEPTIFFGGMGGDWTVKNSPKNQMLPIFHKKCELTFTQLSTNEL
jgi:hypothetical protein